MASSQQGELSVHHCVAIDALSVGGDLRGSRSRVRACRCVHAHNLVQPSPPLRHMCIGIIFSHRAQTAVVLVGADGTTAVCAYKPPGAALLNARGTPIPHDAVRADSDAELKRQLAVANARVEMLTSQLAAVGLGGSVAGRSVASPASAAELGLAFEEVCGKVGLSKDVRTTSGVRRHSVDGGAAPDHAPTDYLGRWFKFENREQECKLLVRAFADMDLHRGKHRFDVEKRDVHVPVCTGMPGIGKTRFARTAVVHLARTATGLSSPTNEQVLNAVPAMASSVWADDGATARMHEDLLRQLVLACHGHRNLRVALTRASCTKESLESDLAVELLAQWAKYRPRAATGAALVLGEDALADNLTVELRRTLAARFMTPTVGAAVEYILSTASEPLAGDAVRRSSDDAPAVIINIDEAQNLRDLLQLAIELLVRPLLVSNTRVFITITGITSDDITAAINASSVKPLDIVLPLLKQDHMVDIVATLFNVRPDAVPHSVDTAVWWTGGVPRFLEYLLRQVAEKARAREGVQGLWAWLQRANMNDVMDVVRMTSKVVMHDQALPSDLLDNLFSLTLAERPIPISCVLTTTGDPVWNVGYAQRRQLLYWEGRPGSDGIVRLPPLVLSVVHQRSAAGAGASVRPLKIPSAHTTSDDIEALAVTALLHRLHAARIANKATIMLSELLGNGPLAGVQDVLLAVAAELSLRVLGHKLERSNFEELARKTRADLVTSPKTTCSAFVNGRRATFADAFIIFPNLSLFVQEKQSVVARQKRAQGRTVSPVPKNEVKEEYDTVSMVVKDAHVFLYITDCRARDSDDEPPPNTIIYTQDKHDKLFGSTLALLRAGAIEENATRAESSAATAAAHAPALASLPPAPVPARAAELTAPVAARQGGSAGARAPATTTAPPRAPTPTAPAAGRR
jgi:hypothetical protein